MVDLKNVSVAYNKGHDVIKGIDIHIDDGDFTFIVGASGAGKSTIIKLLLKEIDASDGMVWVNGYNLRTLKKSRIPKFRRTIGVVFQDFRLIPTMTVYDNIAFVLRVINAPRSYIRKRVPYVIGLVGLQSKIKSYPNELSGGEQQRVALARALVNDPKLLIADEPTGNVDPELSQEIVGLLKAINQCGTTVVMVTHEHELVKHFGGRLININQGKIIYDDFINGESESEEDYDSEAVVEYDSDYDPDEQQQIMSDVLDETDNQDSTGDKTEGV